jgi:Cu-processing system ATP-binding protein
MITFENINKSYGKLKVLQDVNLQLKQGEGVAIVGPNGSGKTTLLKCLLGLAVPDSGNISVENQPVRRDWNYRSRIGYMSQISRFPENLTIGELFAMMKDIRTDCTDYDEELIDTFGLDKMADKKLGSLSGGTKQKVSAALAFLFKPQALILDEPTAGLDPLATEQIKEKIHKEKLNGKLIIITSHIMSDIEELADTLIYIIDGRVQFHWPVSELKQFTGEQSFSRALAKIATEYHGQ